MIVIGLDPSTGAKAGSGLGVGIIRDGKYVSHKTFSSKGDKWTRLYRIANGLSEWLDWQVMQLVNVPHRQVVVAMESSFGRFWNAGVALGNAQGVAIVECMRAVNRHFGEPPTIYTAAPTEIKCAVTGDGRATKGEVQMSVAAVLNLEEVPQEDAADALAVALCAYNHLWCSR